MSIHEVHYDNQGRIIATRCVDEAIDLHRKDPQPNAPSVFTIHESPDITEVNPGIPNTLFPSRIHTLTAINKATVVETDHELRQNRKGTISLVRLAPARILRREEIASARIGDKGFMWTEPGQQVDVYVAPTKPAPRPSFASRVRAAIRI